jgi:hypothetical protein
MAIGQKTERINMAGLDLVVRNIYTSEAGAPYTGTDQLTAATLTVPAATLAIPVTHRFVNKATGGVEALTLADGEPGQWLTITLSTDGGDGTLTPATKTGFATIVFADVKDTATLYYVNDTIGWILIGYYGTAAPPVVS